MVNKTKIIILIVSFYLKLLDSEVTIFHLRKKIAENKRLITIAMHILQQKLHLVC